MLIFGGSGSGKTNPLFNLINQEPELIKFIYILKIHMKQNINYYLKSVKMLEQIILMILKLLWNTQMTWMIFMKRIEEDNQDKKCKILNFF